MKTKRIIVMFLCLVLCVIMGGEGILSAFSLPTMAAGTSASKNDITTSSVRDDLANMGEDKLTYLSNDENIFIGMSQYYDKNDTLRSYIYFNYIGSLEEELTISLSVAVQDANYNVVEDFKPYNLSFVNNDATWVKYEILGLPNIDKTTRRYNLQSISSDPILDINETYIFHGITNDTIEIFNQEVETITITEKEVQFFCYGEESKWFDFWGFDDLLGHNKKYTDAWYIFFNTDKKIDTLKEIEITYLPYDYHIQSLGTVSMSYALTEKVLTDRIEGDDFDEKTTITYGEQTVVTITPGKTKISATDNFWGGYETKYEEIDNILDLRANDHTGENGNEFVFTEQAKKYTWGVNFLNTEKYSIHKSISMMGNGVTTTVIDGTGVCNTAIVRLKYEVNGIVKNAYVIDIPTDDFTGNAADTNIEGNWEKLLGILMLIALILALSFISGPVGVVVRVLWSGIKEIVKLILWILGIPYRLFRWLLSSRKGRSG